MTAKIPIYCLRINNFNFKFVDFLKISNRYDRGELQSFERKEQFLFTMQALFTIFYRIFRDILREENIFEPLPRKILIHCKEKNLYSEIDPWFYFIDYLNEYYELEDKDEKEKLLDYILATYKFKFYNIYNFFRKNYPTKEYKTKVMDLQKNLNSREEIAKNKVIYNADFAKITEKTYNKLINFFKVNKEIKSVWIQGSRVFGTTRNGSDIDLIIDSPLENYEILLEKIHSIRTPYRIDARNINTESHFVKTAIYLGTKLIYNIVDWQ